MTKETQTFLNEINEYSLEDLELIYETQEELYSEHERQIIAEQITKKKKELYDKIKASLPDEIVCPKCDAPNPFENDNCEFCGYKFDKSKYFEFDDTTEESINEPSYAFQYIFSFIIPLVGFILGAILLSKENDDEQSVGKRCIILGIISVVISVLVYMVR